MASNWKRVVSSRSFPGCHRFWMLSDRGAWLSLEGFRGWYCDCSYLHPSSNSNCRRWGWHPGCKWASFLVFSKLWTYHLSPVAVPFNHLPSRLPRVWLTHLASRNLRLRLLAQWFLDPCLLQDLLSYWTPFLSAISGHHLYDYRLASCPWSSFCFDRAKFANLGSQKSWLPVGILLRASERQSDPCVGFSNSFALRSCALSTIQSEWTDSLNLGKEPSKETIVLNHQAMQVKDPLQ